MTLNIIDVARDQAGINLATTGADGALIGFSDGGTVNPFAHQQYAQAKALRMPRGCYHFFRGNSAAEAAFFVANAREVPGDGQIWCDAETYFPDLPTRTLAWLTEVQRLTGIRPAGAYIPGDFLLGRGLDWSPLYRANYGVWEAAYVLGYQRVPAFQVPSGRAPIPLWGAPAMWQYTSEGVASGWGGPLDFSIFYGDATAWQAYVGTVGTDSTTITPIPATTDWFANMTPEERAALIHDIAEANAARTWGYSGGTDSSGAPVTMWSRVANAAKWIWGDTFSKAWNGEVALQDRLTGIDQALNDPASPLHQAIVAQPAAAPAQAPVDVAALAAALAPLLPAAPGALSNLSADELAAIAKAVSDEADARERARLTPPAAS